MAIRMNLSEFLQRFNNGWQLMTEHALIKIDMPDKTTRILRSDLAGKWCLKPLLPLPPDPNKP